KLALEPVHAGRDAGELAVEIDRIGLALAVVELEHLAERIDQKTERFAPRLDTDRHGGFAVVAGLQAQPAAHVDRGDDAAAQVEHAGDLRPGERHAGDAPGPKHFLNAGNRHAEQLAAGGERDVFGELQIVGHGVHAARSMAGSCSLMAAISPVRSNLATKSWKPAARPRVIASADTMAVMAMIGVSAPLGRRRIASASAKPSICGISMSVTTRSKRRPDASASSASAAEPTART